MRRRVCFTGVCGGRGLSEGMIRRPGCAERQAGEESHPTGASSVNAVLTGRRGALCLSPVVQGRWLL